MFDQATLLAYFAAVVAIVLAPGPGQMLVLGRSLSSGRRMGIMTSLGLNIGTLLHTGAAALGLSALLATSAVAFSAVKFLGAAYLLYLGWRALRSSSHEHLALAPRVAALPAVGQAIVTGVLNPKVALFFLALLPQFVHPERGAVALQFLVLGAILAVVGVAWDCVLVGTIGSLSAWLTRHPHAALWRTRVMGFVFIGLGVRLALTER